jgi:hypothetical protein
MLDPRNFFSVTALGIALIFIHNQTLLLMFNVLSLFIKNVKGNKIINIIFYTYRRI